MSMKNEVLEFANQSPVSWLATVDNDVPHVRGMMLWYADESGFYYHTGSCKSLCDQLKKNPNIEAAFYNPGTGPADGRMLRVNGKAEFVKDPELEKKLLEERPFLKDIMESRPDMDLVIFRIHTGEAHFWSMAVNTRESEQPRYTF